MEQREFIDSYTGQTYNAEDYVLKSKAQTKKQYEKISATENPFSFLDIPSIKELLTENKISLPTLGGILVLASYLGEGNYLRKQTHSKELMTREEVQTKLEMSDSTFKRFLKEARALNLILVEEVKRKQMFRLNPEYHVIGAVGKRAKDMARLQKLGINRLWEDKTIKLEQIGFLYMLIPYLSYENCTLVRDYTQEATADNCIGLNEIAEITGLKKAQVKKNLGFSFKYNVKAEYYNTPISVTIKNNDTKAETIMLHPVLFRRKKDFFSNIRFKELENVFKSVSVRL